MTNIKSPIIFALEAESCGRFDDQFLIHSGVGKVNAAYALMKHITQHGVPQQVINVGTAGSTEFATGSVVQCTKFIQRDMDATAFGYERYQTPNSLHGVIIEPIHPPSSLPQAICGTGDSFETALKTNTYNVVDMEAYALAHICLAENIPFLCLKFISDGADDAAHLEWEEALEAGSKALRRALEENFDEILS